MLDLIKVAVGSRAASKHMGIDSKTPLTEDMRHVIAEQKLAFVATVCPDGTPNLSPKGTIGSVG